MAKIYVVTCPNGGCKLGPRNLTSAELQKIMSGTTIIRHPGEGENNLRGMQDAKPKPKYELPWAELLPCPGCGTVFYYNYETGESKL